MTKKLTFLFILAYLFLLKACGQTSEKAYHAMLKTLYSNSVPVITPQVLKQKLDNGKQELILLDTRTEREYTVSHLPNATYIGYDDFNLNQLHHLPKNTPLIVYCSVGYRSEKVGEKLKKAGYTNVYNLYGGLFEWVNKGYTITNAKGPTTKVHAYSQAWGIWLNKGEKVYE
ncbi:rhodanese-like domain-containing protein [uncultured Pontibacter sp.]|uniref:rhodanese-like domain-containing protein n=1 Tax=uncultured Pontibacter sp. TaxID=453356 RepID=UPI002638F184|nr:rhodanese-like domain-containing protein [uncultured Pontibacter sp.]